MLPIPSLLVFLKIYSLLNGFEGKPIDAAWAIWNTKIRYLGVGAMVVGGIWSLIKLFKPLMDGINASLDALKQRDRKETLSIDDQDFPINYVGIALGILDIFFGSLFCLIKVPEGYFPAKISS